MIRRRSRALWWWTGALLATQLACASALRPPAEDSPLGRADPALVDAVAAARWSQEAEDELGRRPAPDAVLRAEQLFLQAAMAAPASAAPIIGAVRAQVWLASHLADPAERERAATRAVQTAQWCERREPEEPECQYRLALALGVQANERRSTAYDGLKRMVDRLRLAIDAIPEVDFAGPHRVLARVLVNAPGWPAGPGDPDLGLDHALAAVDLYPEYPPNLLALAEAYAEVDQPDSSRHFYERARDQALAMQREDLDPDAAEWVREAAAALARSRD